MRHPVKQASQLAFDLLDPVKVSKTHRSILRHVVAANDVKTDGDRGRPICRKQICLLLAKPFHAMSPRFTELIKLELLEEYDEPRVDFDGRSHSWLKVTEAGRREARQPDRPAKGTTGRPFSS